LTALHGDGRLVTTASAPDWLLGKLGDGLFPGMPRFLDHQRPQGSLGCQLGPRCARHGHPGARTELVHSRGRPCLESTRFDRIGTHDRRGLVTLAAWSDAHDGNATTRSQPPRACGDLAGCTTRHWNRHNADGGSAA